MTIPSRRVYAAGGGLGLAVLLIIILLVARSGAAAHASDVVLTVPRDALEDTPLSFVARGSAEGELELTTAPAGRACRQAAAIAPSTAADGRFLLRGTTDIPDPGRHQLCLLHTEGTETKVVARRPFVVRAARASVTLSAPSSVSSTDRYDLFASGRTDKSAELIVVHSLRPEACDPIDPRPTESEIQETFTIERGSFREEADIGWQDEGSATACAIVRDGGSAGRVMALARRSVLVSGS
jgi:hypothetical protein